MEVFLEKVLVVVRSVVQSLVNYRLYLNCIKRVVIFGYLLFGAQLVAYGQNSSNSDFNTFKLANGFTLQIQSDPTLEATSVALSVEAGSLNDPIGFSGMAHLVEHLFLASSQEKSVTAKPSLRQLVNQWGGQLNAHTEAENTLYYFQITPEATKDLLNTAASRLAHSVVGTAVDGEILANELVVLDHEFTLRSESRRWQERDALKALVPAHHPFHRMHPGSKESLTHFGTEELSHAIELFQRRYYHPAATTLVIASPIAEEELLKWANKDFAEINNAYGSSPTVAPLFSQQNLPKSIDIATPYKQQQLTLMFPSQLLPASVDNDVFRYLQYMLESEHAGSLIHGLRQAGLATGISASKGISVHSQNSFQITLNLTELGWTSIPQVKKDLTSYFKLMESKAFEDWRIEEFNHLERLTFVKQQREWSTLDRVRRLALKQSIEAPDFAKDVFKARVKAWLTQLQKDDAIVIRIGDKVVAQGKSPVFGTPYGLPSGENEQVIKTQMLVDRDFQLPPRNPYIPTQWHAIKASDSLFEGAPQLMVDHQNVEVWYGVDGAWAEDMASIQLLLSHSDTTNSIENAVSSEVILEAVNQRLSGLKRKLEPLAYELNITSQSQGIAVSLSGHAETLPQLAITILQNLQQPLTRKEYHNARITLANQWQSAPRYGFEELFNQLFVELLKRRWDSKTMLETMSKLQFETMLAQQQQLFPSQSITALIYGQMTKERANGFVSKLMEDKYISSSNHSYAFDPSPLKEQESGFPLQILKTGSQKHVSVNTINSDNAFVLYHQAINGDPVTTGTLDILRQLLHTRYFQRLRNELKMGYAVFVTSFPVYNLAGFAMTVQSPNSSPAAIEQQTDSFLQDFNLFLNDLDEQQFERAKAGVEKQLSWSEKTPKEKAEMLWQHILTGRLQEFLTRQESELVDQISLADIRDYYQNYIIGQKGNRLVLESRAGDLVDDEDHLKEKKNELVETNLSM